MTIQLLHAFNGLSPGVYSDLGSAEEARLVGLALARYYTVDIDDIPPKSGLDALAAEYAANTLASGPNVAALIIGVYRNAAFDSGVGNTMPTLVATVNAATDIIAAERIQAANPSDAFSTAVDGNSTTGEVISIRSSQPGVYITSVHVGFSNGVSSVLASSTTVTANQIAKFEFDAADEVVAARIYISPPRGTAGRYMDVSVIGQQA